MNTLIALLAAAGSFGTVLMFGTLGEILTEKSGSQNSTYNSHYAI